MARIKGIIMDNKLGQVVILSPEGEYIKLRTNRPLEVGELYEDPATVSWKSALAVVVVLALTLGTIDFFSAKAYAQVSDAVELGVNRWGRVVTTRALNDEGAQILQNTDLKGKKIETAVEDITIQTENNRNLGNDREWKDFPEQAVDKGNKTPEFIERVEGNMNQQHEAKEKSNQSINNSDNAGNNSNKNSGKSTNNGNNNSSGAE